MKKKYLVTNEDIKCCLYMTLMLSEFKYQNIKISKNQELMLKKIFNGYLDLIERCQNEYKNK